MKTSRFCQLKSVNHDLSIKMHGVISLSDARRPVINGNMMLDPEIQSIESGVITVKNINGA